MNNNSQSSENDYIIAALSYFPFVSLFTIFTSGRNNYYIKYHSSHAILFYLFNLVFLALSIVFYWFLRDIFGFFVNAVFGLAISLQMIVGFSLALYYSTQAYQGKYIVIPAITKIFYSFFK